MSIRDAIADLGVKVKQGKKEDEQDYLKRIFAALSEEFSDDPKDKKWKAFGTKAQEWYNAASEAGDDKEDLPHFETEDEEDEGEADEPKAKKAKGNGKVKTKVKGKRAKAADEDEDEADEDDDEPKSKKGKGKAKAAKGKKGNGASRRSPPAFEDNQVIKVLNKDAHNEGSDIRTRFKKLKTGMTVGAARKAGLSMLDLKCDVQRGNLSIK